MEDETDDVVATLRKLNLHTKTLERMYLVDEACKCADTRDHRRGSLKPDKRVDFLWTNIRRIKLDLTDHSDSLTQFMERTDNEDLVARIKALQEKLTAMKGRVDGLIVDMKKGVSERLVDMEKLEKVSDENMAPEIKWVEERVDFEERGLKGLDEDVKEAIAKEQGSAIEYPE